MSTRNFRVVFICTPGGSKFHRAIGKRDMYRVMYRVKCRYQLWEWLVMSDVRRMPHFQHAYFRWGWWDESQGRQDIVAWGCDNLGNIVINRLYNTMDLEDNLSSRSRCRKYWCTSDGVYTYLLIPCCRRAYDRLQIDWKQLFLVGV